MVKMDLNHDLYQTIDNKSSQLILFEVKTLTTIRIYKLKL